MPHALARFALVSLLLCGASQSQQPKPPSNICPTIIVDCPSGLSQSDELLTFTATVTGASSTKLDYNWTVSTGTIRSGQGTPTIQVENTEHHDGMTGVVTVTGLPTGCTNSAACSFISCPAPQGRQFDKYSRLTFAAERKRLDAFADELKAQPGAQGYVIVSPGRADTEQAALKRAARAQSYLVNTCGLEAGRIVMGAGEARKQLIVELYIVPPGATPPPLKAQ
jgi:hypothetical protein